MTSKLMILLVTGVVVGVVVVLLFPLLLLLQQLVVVVVVVPLPPFKHISHHFLLPSVHFISCVLICCMHNLQCSLHQQFILHFLNLKCISSAHRFFIIENTFNCVLAHWNRQNRVHYFRQMSAGFAKILPISGLLICIVSFVSSPTLSYSLFIVLFINFESICFRDFY